MGLGLVGSPIVTLGLEARWRRNGLGLFSPPLGSRTSGFQLRAGVILSRFVFSDTLREFRPNGEDTATS